MLKPILFTVLLLLLAAAIAIALFIRRKKLLAKDCALNILKSVMDVNYGVDSIKRILRDITVFARARSCFVVDIEGLDYNYIAPPFRDKLLMDKNREYFVMRLLNYSVHMCEEQDTVRRLCTIKANRKLKKKNSVFYDFLKKNEIHKVINVVLSYGENVYMIGLIDPKRLFYKSAVKALLKEGGIYLSLALNNQTKLDDSDKLAKIDAITGIWNRTAYNADFNSNQFYIKKDYFCIYLDVNELNDINNRYGHEAGDRMLIAVAGILKKVFFDSRIYRMGGDEFLIVSVEADSYVIDQRIKNIKERLAGNNYHVSIGIKRGSYIEDISDVINEAEKLMYEDKAAYYSEKMETKSKENINTEMQRERTGIAHIDECLNLVANKYMGVYCVSHAKDSAIIVASSQYFTKTLEKTGKFSVSVKKYVSDYVKSEHKRKLYSLMEYTNIENQFKTRGSINAEYEKIDGVRVVLRIYPASNTENDIDSIWVLESIGS